MVRQHGESCAAVLPRAAIACALLTPRLHASRGTLLPLFCLQLPVVIHELCYAPFGVILVFNQWLV